MRRGEEIKVTGTVQIQPWWSRESKRAERERERERNEKGASTRAEIHGD